MINNKRQLFRAAIFLSQLGHIRYVEVIIADRARIFGHPTHLAERGGQNQELGPGF